MSLLPTIISLASGALGGNVAGSLIKKYSLGTLGNSIVGILGGGLGGYILNMLGLGGVAANAASSSMDVSSIIGTLVSGGVGGGALMTIVGLIKSMMNK